MKKFVSTLLACALAATPLVSCGSSKSSSSEAKTAAIVGAWDLDPEELSSYGDVEKAQYIFNDDGSIQIVMKYDGTKFLALKEDKLIYQEDLELTELEFDGETLSAGTPDHHALMTFKRREKSDDMFGEYTATEDMGFDNAIVTFKKDGTSLIESSMNGKYEWSEDSKELSLEMDGKSAETLTAEVNGSELSIKDGAGKETKFSKAE